MGIQNRTKEETHTLEIFPSILMEETLQPQPNMGMGGKNNSLSLGMEIDKRSRIPTKKVFPSIQKRGQREEIVRETEDLSVLGLKRR
ncbi:MAG: hypothetical protein EZS28_011072 [Streblomastix strix]|uniref:Uncharacterized protein n=1 Tax=Streblomastix strix TaxID=222440 RepID=A0A5J4WFW2_9EUKA|nr:MAG: hypothetical protein EZS28_011072 [Streblomastix strix]